MGEYSRNDLYRIEEYLNDIKKFTDDIYRYLSKQTVTASNSGNVGGNGGNGNVNNSGNGGVSLILPPEVEEERKKAEEERKRAEEERRKSEEERRKAEENRLNFWKDFNVRDYRTGVRGIDSAIYDWDTKSKGISQFGENITKFGKVFGENSAVGKKIANFGNKIQKAAGGVAGFIEALQGILHVVGLATEVSNIKGKAASAAIHADIKENELQFQRDSQLLTLNADAEVNRINYMGDMALKSMEVEGAIMLKGLEIMTKNQVKAVEIAVGPLIEGINQTAYKAAEYALERKKDLRMLGVERQKLEKERGIFAAKITKEYGLQQGAIAASKNVALSNYEGASMTNAMEKATGARDYEAEVKKLWVTRGPEIGAEILGGVGAAGGSFFGPEGTIIGGVGGAASGFGVGFGVGLYKALTDKTVDESYRESAAKTRGMVNTVNGNRSFDNAKYDFRNDDHMLSSTKKVINDFIPMFSTAKEDIWKAQGDVYASNLRMMSEGNRIAVEASNKIISAQLEKQTALQEKANELQYEANRLIVEQGIEEEKNWLKLTIETEKWLDNFDKLTNNLGISMGYTNSRQLDNFQRAMFSTSAVAGAFGKQTEDLLKMQQGFIETTGRNRIFDEHDFGQLTALGKYLGDDGLATSFASGMEIFNVGVAESVDLLDEALQDVNKIGLNGRKYAKTLVDNLKLAQKYNFKGGTKGLMEMAKWAENTRFNMASLSSMIDKVQEGGLENVIKMGAEFQVLGGHAAMNADPIAMMYEAFADPEAYVKRLQDMTIGYGSMNKETGEVDFSGPETMLMRQLAKIQGRSYEEVANEARARLKKEEVAKQLNGNFTDDELSFITNNAVFDRKTHSYKVKVNGENGYKDLDVSQLTKEDLDKLMPAEHNERMEEYMVKVIDKLSALEGFTEISKAVVGESYWDDRAKNYQERLFNAQESFVTNYTTYTEKIKEYGKFITDSYKDYTQEFNKSAEDAQAKVNEINGLTNRLANALGATAGIINDANRRLKEAADNIGKPIEEFQGRENGKGERSSLTHGSEYSGGSGGYSLKLPDGSIWHSSKPAGGVIGDLIANNNNAPIVSQAAKVTKINDGLVKSDPKDVAIFAKEGGVIGNFIADLYNDIHSSNMGAKDVNIHINGSLELSSNGQSVDIINELRNDPIMLRTLSRLISKHITTAWNGGRGTSNIAIPNT